MRLFSYLHCSVLIKFVKLKTVMFERRSASKIDMYNVVLREARLNE